MILTLWRDVREAYYDAARKWMNHDNETAIFLLRLAVKRTQTLILALEKEGNHGRTESRIVSKRDNGTGDH